MNNTTNHKNAMQMGHQNHHHDVGEMKVFGFWIYLMTDCVIFASLFAMHAVLADNYAGGPTGKDIFDLKYVLVETFLLLFSSVTFGFAMLGMIQGKVKMVLFWMAVTFLFGAGFIAMEINEFHHLIADGHGPDVSAFLSAYFGLVGTHGLHVTLGLVWMLVMFIQIQRWGINEVTKMRMMCLSLFWHFLDLVWVCVFTFVYLVGVL